MRVTMRLSILVLLGFMTAALPLHAEEKKDAVVPLAPAPAAPPVASPAAPTAPSAAVPAAPATLPGNGTAVTVPDISTIPFMQNLQKIGASIYYLGEMQGLDGWLVAKDTQVQILYSTKDKKSILVGALLTAEGANLSQQQVMLLASNNPEVSKILKSSAPNAGNAPNAAMTAPSSPGNNAATANNAGNSLVSNAQPAPDSANPSANASPSEKFFDALLKTPSFTFGKDGAPRLLMIMDVNCPHCHNAWNMLAPLVDSGQLRVTMIPIAALGTQSVIEGANWLSSKDPYVAWKKHVAGDEKIFQMSQADPAKMDAVRANTDLIRKWGVDQTPYILYHGKNGKVRLVIGEPRDIGVISGDLGN